MTMNLHAIAGPIAGIVNGTTIGNVLISTGSTIAPGGKQVPTYDRSDGVDMNVQAMSWKDLQHTDGLNIQGAMKAVYLYGAADAVTRPRNKGGDLLEFDGKTWLVHVVIEDWPGWCKVAVTEQMEKPNAPNP